MITEGDIKEAIRLFPAEHKGKLRQHKPVWLLDCFRYRISPEDCDPKGCFECIHWKELKEKYS